MNKIDYVQIEYTYVLSNVTYGSEMWGYFDIFNIETLHHILKRILKVQKSTTNYMRMINWIKSNLFTTVL